MLTIREALEIDAPPGLVWAALADVRQVVGCIPGAVLGEEVEEGVYSGQLKLAFGPIRATFDGNVRVSVDAVQRSCEIDGRGVDGNQRNRTRATATIHQVSPADGEKTSLVVDATVEVSGPLSQFVNTGGAQLTRALLLEFGSALEEMLAEPTDDGVVSHLEHAEIRPARVMFALVQQRVRRIVDRLLGRRGRRAGVGGQ